MASLASGVITPPLTVAELLQQKAKEWDLTLVAGSEGLDAVISTDELNRPGLALAGYYEVFSAERIQLIGLTETSYLKSLQPDLRLQCIRRTLSFSIPCVIVTTGLEICEELRTTCEEKRIPLLRTSNVTSRFQSDLGHYLEKRLAPSWTHHGVMMDVFGMGVLIQGKSGVGKSECGLELIERGHRLIADDVVILRRIGKNELIGVTPPHIGYHMEIRGIGIIDVELLYGVRAVRDEAPVSLIVTLEKWDPAKDYERLGLTEHTIELHECRIPEYVLPLEPGRNIAKLIEVAALTQRLEDQGVHVARDFDQQIIRAIREKGQAPRPMASALERLRRREQANY